MIDSPPEPFYDLAACVKSARWAAESARKLAISDPLNAQHHMERAEWYDQRAADWLEELHRVAHEELRQNLLDSLALEGAPDGR